ncbi:MAG: pilus assembly protein N-terminal domain-containing protein [Caulobacter sp.]|nr:pilus assembly protein N-terminal domain-containing protein [Caulobacter sp.]
MTRIFALFAAVTTLAAAGAAWGQSLPVRIDQASRVTLSATARDVVIGNPSVADVTVIDGRNLLVMGKAYGVTNLVVLDARGRTILDRQIVVSASDDGRISFYRGPDVYNYSCSPRCERTPMPGERDSGQGVYGQWAGPYSDYPGRAEAAGAKPSGAK